MNQAAKSMIPSAERVIFMYNPGKQHVGFQPSSDPKLSRPLRKTKGQNTWSLAGEGFLKAYNIDHHNGRSYEPYMDGDVLVVDLHKPKPQRKRKQNRGGHDEGK
jgi:hypothetical protein